MLIYWALVLVTTIPSPFEINISSPLPGEAGMVCDLERISEESYAGCGILIDNYYPQFAIFDLRYASSSPDPTGEISSHWQYLQTGGSFIEKGAMALDVCDPSIIPSIIACGQIRDNSVHSSGIHILQSDPYEDFSNEYSHSNWVSSLLYDIIYLPQDGLWISCGEYVIDNTPNDQPSGYILAGNTDGIVQHEVLEEDCCSWQSIEYDSEVDLALLGGSISIISGNDGLRFGIYNDSSNELYHTSKVLGNPPYRSLIVKPISRDEQKVLALQISLSAAMPGISSEYIALSLWSYDDNPPNPLYRDHVSYSNTSNGEFRGYGFLSVIAVGEDSSSGRDTCEFKVLIVGADCEEFIPLEWFLLVYTLEINISDMEINSFERIGNPICTGDFIPSDFIFDHVDLIEGTGCGDTGLSTLGEISLFTLSENRAVVSTLRESNTSPTPLEITVISRGTDGFPAIRISSGNDSRVNLRVHDITGRIVISRTVDVPYFTELSWTELVGEQSSLTSGLYLISADENCSESMVTAKILLY